MSKNTNAAEGKRAFSQFEASTLEEIHKRRQRLARINAAKKKLDSKLALDEAWILNNFPVGTHQVEDFIVEVSESLPDCRPKWKEEFASLATRFKLNAKLEVETVIEKVKKTLEKVKGYDLKKLT